MTGWTSSVVAKSLVRFAGVSTAVTLIVAVTGVLVVPSLSIRVNVTVRSSVDGENELFS